MKQVLIITALIILCIACNDTGNTNNTSKHDEPKTHADSLLKDVMSGHDIAMGKMSKLSAAQKHVQQAIDSMNKLPEKLKKAAADYKTELDSLSEKLKYAEYEMNKWMDEFNYDSATNGSNRSGYLESENQKVSKVKETMLSVLQKADSLFNK